MQPNDLNVSARNGNEESTEHRHGMTSNGNNVDQHGTTRGLHTQKYIRRTGEKPKIYIPEGINKAVGQNCCMFASEIGVRITLDAPMQVEGWAKISDDDKEDLYRKLAIISATQSRNRLKLKHQHKLGTKSRAAHQYEKNLDDIEMYEEEFYNPKTGWADEEVESNCARMKEKRKEQEEFPNGSTRMTPQQICVDILGENSTYAKSKGLQPKKSNRHIESSSVAFSNRARLGEELAATKEELANAQTKLFTQ